MKKQLFILIYCVAIITTGRIFTAAQPTQNDLTFFLVQAAGGSGGDNTREEDLAQVRRLIARGARVNDRCVAGSRVESGMTALQAAAVSGRLDIVRYLIERAGADVNGTSVHGESALMAAAHNGHVDVVRYLVGVPGIDLNKRYLAVEGWPAETALESAYRVLQNREREIRNAAGPRKVGYAKKIANYERIIAFLEAAGAAPAAQESRLVSDAVQLSQRADVPGQTASRTQAPPSSQTATASIASATRATAANASDEEEVQCIVCFEGAAEGKILNHFHGHPQYICGQCLTDQQGVCPVCQSPMVAVPPTAQAQAAQTVGSGAAGRANLMAEYQQAMNNDLLSWEDLFLEYSAAPLEAFEVINNNRDYYLARLNNNQALLQQIIELLVEGSVERASLLLPDFAKSSHVFALARRSNWRAIRALVDQGADVNVSEVNTEVLRTSDRSSLLSKVMRKEFVHDAYSNEQYDLIIFLLERGARLVDGELASCIIFFNSSVPREVDLLRRLINSGARITQQEIIRYTPSVRINILNTYISQLDQSSEHARIANEWLRLAEQRVREEEQRAQEARLAQQRQEEARRAEQRRLEEQQRVREAEQRAQEVRLAQQRQEEARRAEQRRLEEQQRVREAEQRAQEARLAQQRQEETRRAEQRRLEDTLEQVLEKLRDKTLSVEAHRRLEKKRDSLRDELRKLN